MLYKKSTKIGGIMSNNKEKIINLYYEKKLNTVEIAMKLNISKQYVSKIVKNDSRHSKEVLRRKQESKIKQVERNKRCIQNKRKKDYDSRLNSSVELLHIQASYELSGRKTINNRAFRDWNTSIYEYNYKIKEYQLKNEFKNKTSYAVPKRVKWN